VVNTVPDVSKDDLPPFDYIVTTTKNCPDISPTLQELIRPAVTPHRTTIVMIQNGLNIEQAMFEAFPTNVVLSGVSMIDSHEGQLGEILHEDKDLLHLGAFQNPALGDHQHEIAMAHKFIQIYGAGGKTDVRFSENVPWARWRKLVFNAVLNPLCAITGMDDARIRLTNSLVDGLVKPAMKEIVDTAAKLGHILPEDIIDTMIYLDPIDLYLKPSMQCDIEKVSLERSDQGAC
jgi:ketopantoate reductase